jgi:hypothetical protein
VNLQLNNGTDRRKSKFISIQEKIERGHEDIKCPNRSIWKEQLAYANCGKVCKKDLIKVIQAAFAAVVKTRERLHMIFTRIVGN